MKGLIPMVERLEPRALLSEVTQAGPEFRVNTFTPNAQNAQAIAADDAGNFVIAWQSNGQSGRGKWDVYAQRYSAAGTPQGGEFRVNLNSTTYSGGGAQKNVSIAMDADGDFVVAWSGGGMGNNMDIIAQRFNAAGVKQGAEFRVNTYITNIQSVPAVAMDSNGAFVIAWDSYAQDGSLRGIYAQRFEASGVRQGVEFRVNTTTTNNQQWPSAAMDADGDFVITWDGNGPGDSIGVFAQRYNAAGVKQGAEFRVNTFTTDMQALSSVAMDPGGNFIVAWESNLQDGSSMGVFAQRFDSTGAASGAEFRVNTYSTGFQGIPSLAVDAAGGFVITWMSQGQDGSDHGVFARRYDAAGLSLGDELQVNTYTTSWQRDPVIAAGAAGNFVITWRSNGQDGSGDGVYAQRYAVVPPTAPTFSSAPITDAQTNRTGVALRDLFGDDQEMSLLVGMRSAR
jgi:hypothetical protein